MPSFSSWTLRARDLWWSPLKRSSNALSPQSHKFFINANKSSDWSRDPAADDLVQPRNRSSTRSAPLTNDAVDQIWRQHIIEYSARTILTAAHALQSPAENSSSFDDIPLRAPWMSRARINADDVSLTNPIQLQNEAKRELMAVEQNYTVHYKCWCYYAPKFMSSAWHSVRGGTVTVDGDDIIRGKTEETLG
jgi:hypothetical protein